MKSFLESALELADRGWAVHPLRVGDKQPTIPDWPNRASTDANRIREWWGITPNANVGIACGLSNLFVVDVDHGLASWEDFNAWRERNNLPKTYTVRTGRRENADGSPAYAVQMYYSGAIECNGAWELDGCRGEIRSAGGQVMAVGNIHPVTKERYALIGTDIGLASRPAVFEQSIRKPERPKPGEPVRMLGKGEGRHPLLMSKLGLWHRQGLTECEAIGAAGGLNVEQFTDPIPDAEIEETVRTCWSKWLPTEVPPEVVIGKGTPVQEAKAELLDWKTRYHTFDEMNDAPPPSFLIEGFLQKDVISAIAAPVAQRKSLIAANVAHALLTTGKLFDHFVVTERPERVIYLCPEMGLHSFADRLKRLGLMEYVGKTLFCRTMNSEGRVLLADLSPEELTGACVIVDTAVRFIQGDENSSEHMRVFAEECFGLMKGGAASVLVLFHSGKGTKETSELTLENAMRGSGELGAFVSSCWATRLQNPEEPYKSASFLTNVKQRDFESKPFEVTCGADCRLHIVAPPDSNVVLNSKAQGNKSNADGREDEAIQMLKDNPDLPIRGLVLMLKEAGIQRGKTWVSDKRFEVLNRGVKGSSARGRVN